MEDCSHNGEEFCGDIFVCPVFQECTNEPPAILHRAFLRAGVNAQLVVFEALPHAFWNNAHLPETKEADDLMAAFFGKHLSK